MALLKLTVRNEMLNLNKKDFINALKFCFISAGKKDVRTYLNSVNIEVKHDHVMLVATDGHRVSSARLHVKDDISSLDTVGNSFNVQRDSVERIIKAVAITGKTPDKDIVQLRIVKADAMKSVATLSVDGMSMDLGSDAGVFPDWRRIVHGKFNVGVDGERCDTDKHDGIAEIGFLAGYLADIDKAFEIVSKSKYNEVTIEFSESARQVVKICSGGALKSCGQLVDATMYLMPCEIKRMGDK